MGSPPAAWIFLTSLLLRTSTEPGECKVYFDCGAVLNPEDRDLILSPGFPNNYLPSSHCLWQIFVPAGSAVGLEILDFDVFDSSVNEESAASYSIPEFPKFISSAEYERERKNPSTENDLSNDLEIGLTEEKVVSKSQSSNQVSTETWSKSDGGYKPLTDLQNPNLFSKMSSTVSADTTNESRTEEINKSMHLLEAVTNGMETVPFEQNGIQNTALEVNELQLVVSDEDLPTRELENGSQIDKGQPRGHFLHSEDVLLLQESDPVADVSQQSQQDDPSLCTITATDTNSDEVFIISPGNHTNGLALTSSHLQVGNLKRSVTSPASVSDWLTSDYTNVDLTVEDKGNEGEEVAARQRAWSVRTFNSLLPQLQMKWRSRTSSGSFTKLLDRGCPAPVKTLCPKIPRRVGSAAQIGENCIRLYSESSDSNASYPLTHSAHLHRHLPSGNLKRARPCFGLLNDSSDSVCSDQTSTFAKENHNLCQKPGTEYPNSLKIPSTNGVRAKELSMDFEKPNAVFVICEEADDQQPLVFDDQLSSPTECELHSSYISCKANNCSLSSKRSCNHLSPWMKSSDVSIYQCIQKNASIKPHCTTTVGRPDYAGSTDFQSPPIALVTE
ncbi:uncharacterized protein [Dendrobates tinctorius]|uniref:uncharacterized protein isoform X3 n=1 Tax=Dendrobates tinctorius TaxID=92724 RepID=UPI003CC9A190